MRASASLELPSYFSPADAGALYLERVDRVSAEAERIQNNTTLQSCNMDTFKIAVFAIDCQGSFCLPQGSLFVPGAVEDTARAVSWIYRNLGQITTLVFSQDAHHAHQIFHPAWWRDEAGRPPPPFTAITVHDVRAGRWIPVRAPEASLEYLERLAVTQRYTLTIWPYHCLTGGVGQAVVPALGEAALLHSLTRGATPVWVNKGSHPLTESYSVLSPEVTEVGGETVGAFDEALVQTLMGHDRVYVFGQASSHCVSATLLDLRRRLEREDPALLSRIWVLCDAMSPVPPPPIDPLPPALDFPAVARATLAELGEAGMVLSSTAHDIGG